MELTSGPCRGKKANASWRKTDAFDNLVGSLAQLVEQRTLNPRAKGSNPLRPMVRSVAHGLPSVLFSCHDRSHNCP